MTRRLHFTLEEVLKDMLSDDEDLDLDEPMMEVSDDEFSDLEVDADEDDIDSTMDVIGAQGLTTQKYSYPLSYTIFCCKNRPQIYSPCPLLFFSRPESGLSHFSRALESRPFQFSSLESRLSYFYALSLGTRVRTLPLPPPLQRLSALSLVVNKLQPPHKPQVNSC